MDKLKLGQICTEPMRRDAVHLAVVQVKAGNFLKSGDTVSVTDGVAWKCDVEYSLGVVDPYLKTHVKQDQIFWLYLNPGSITSLHHEWTHPAFPDTVVDVAKFDTGTAGPKEKALKASEDWIRNFADECGISYETLMDGAIAYVSHEDYLCLGELLEGLRVPDTFWPHYQNVTQTEVPEDSKHSFFTCSC